MCFLSTWRTSLYMYIVYTCLLGPCNTAGWPHSSPSNMVSELGFPSLPSAAERRRRFLPNPAGLRIPPSRCSAPAIRPHARLLRLAPVLARRPLARLCAPPRRLLRATAPPARVPSRARPPPLARPCAPPRRPPARPLRLPSPRTPALLRPSTCGSVLASPRAHVAGAPVCRSDVSEPAGPVLLS